MRHYLILIVSIICLALLGCHSLIERGIPCEFPKPASDYLNVENPLRVTTAHRAKELEVEMRVKHRNEQEKLLRQMQDDTYHFQIGHELFKAAITVSDTVRDTVIGSPSQPLSIAGLLGVAGLAHFAGLKRKRDGDYTPEEHDADVQAAYLAGKNGD